MQAAVDEEHEAHPQLDIEVWAADEHRLGLKPVVRRVWAPVGEQPIASGHHRYEWLHVTAFVCPATGESEWYLTSTVNKPLFAKILADFARLSGAGVTRRIIITVDNAGWHGPEGLTVPDGLRLVYLPSYTPELQPAERLWPLVDEPVANQHFETLAELDAVIGKRCVELYSRPEELKAQTGFHWWPKPCQPN